MRFALRTLIVLVPCLLPAVQLFGAEGPAGLAAIVKRLESGQATRIVCFGDSITGAYYHTGGQRAWCDMLGIALARIYPTARVQVLNAGISGNTSEQGLARIDKDVLEKEPHLVVVMFGMNDVARATLDQFAANLRSIVEKCHGAKAAVVLCTPNNVYENTARPNAKLAELSENVRVLGRELSLPIADCFADYERWKAHEQEAWMLMMSDDIHPNMHGHCRFAERIAETISGRSVELGLVPPPADALHHTLARLARGESVHLVAMPPYDRWMAEELRSRFPAAQIKVTTWPVEGKSLAELRQWGAGIRQLQPDLVVPAVPAEARAPDTASYIRDYEWVLNFSFPFAGRAWDVVPVLPAVTRPLEDSERERARLARQIVLGKDVRHLAREVADEREAKTILSAWIDAQDETRLTTWPALPPANATVSLPAQEWPLRPGRRNIRVLVHYPGGKLENVKASTGTMLTLHNWGGDNCIGTADPQILADRLNVVALCVNYLQSGKADGVDGPEPYDFGYLQALDALRALWWLQTQLRAGGQAFDSGRTFATGGSGGGNVALMANKLAPRTFACIVDLCGMKKLSADMAFNLPGGSDLDARWSRDPGSLHYLSPDEQDLRFVGHPEHLRTMQRLGSTARIVVVHGVDDTTCPFADAQEMVDNMQAADLSVEPRFIRQSDLDGEVFTSSGHALGNRTQIVLKVAEPLLAAEGPQSLRRASPGDFERRDELVRYSTPGGEYVISYAAGFPQAHFAAKASAPRYPDHGDLMHHLDSGGSRHEVHTPEEWTVRRNHIVAHLESVMGNLPSASMRVPLSTRVLEEFSRDGLVYRKVSYQSDPFDRVAAWLQLPRIPSEKKAPAVLCLHQTTDAGKAEPAGLTGRTSMHYGRELAERGYVVLAPDYPSLGEHEYDLAAHPEYESGSMKAIWDNIRAVDLLAAQPEVDPARIGAIGHSLGGHSAIFTAVFEPRLKAVVSSCGFTSLAKDDLPSWSGPRYMPRIANRFGNDLRQLPFDFPELVAAIAPRPLFVSAAERDDDFDVEGVKDVLRLAEPVYRLYGRPEHLTAYFPDSEHDFPDEARRRAYEFLDRHLMAPANGK